MSAPDGYKLPQAGPNSFVANFPQSETRCAPFNVKRLDNIVADLFLTKAASQISAMRLVFLCLNSATTRKKAPGTIEAVLYAVRRTCEFLNGLDNPQLLTNDKGIFEVDLKNWLIEIGLAESTIGETLNILIGLVKAACLLPNTDHLKNEAVHYICLHSRRYHKQRNPTPTLDGIYPHINLHANDKDLLIGLRETMTWYLLKMTNARSELMKKLPKSLSGYLSHLTKNKADPKSKRQHFSIFSSSGEGYPYDGLMKDLVAALADQKSSTINEQMFCSMNSRSTFQKTYINDRAYLSESELAEYFQVLACDSGTTEATYLQGANRPDLKRCYVGKIDRIRRTERTEARFPTLSFLVYPTLDESLAMEWLLASDRIQVTGIQNLNIESNVLWDKQNRTFQFKNIIKHRRIGEQHTDTYRGDVLYDVYSSWVTLLNAASNYVGDLDGKIIPPFAGTAKSSRQARHFHLQRTGFWLLALEGTHTQNELLADLADTNNLDRVKEFLSLLSAHMFQIKMISDQQSATKRRVEATTLKRTDLNAENCDGIRDTKRSPQMGVPSGINIKVITQTRAVIDDAIMTGRLVGHNDVTHENIYINRTRSRFVNAQSASFAAEVGNEMRRIAETLAKKVRLVSVDEAKAILGISKTNPAAKIQMQEIIQSAEKQGFVAYITSELIKENHTYVVISPWSAALIQGYIKNIDLELHSVEFTNTKKREDVSLKAAYLQLLLERFPRQVVAAGEEILENWKIPFPRLV